MARHDYVTLARLSNRMFQRPYYVLAPLEQRAVQKALSLHRKTVLERRRQRAQANRLCNYSDAQAYQADHSMASLPLQYLTDLGREALSTCVGFVGRKPKWKGANSKGIYLKWVVRSEEEAVALTVVVDRLIDMGLEVELEESLNDRTGEKYRKLSLR